LECIDFAGKNASPEQIVGAGTGIGSSLYHPGKKLDNIRNDCRTLVELIKIAIEE